MKVFCFLIIVLSLSCGSRQLPSEAQAPQSQPSDQKPRIDIQLLWEERVKNIDFSKVRKGAEVERLSILEALLEQAPPEQVQAEFERLRSSPTPANKLTDYDTTLLQLLVERAVKRGERDRLVDLLSAKCPRFVGVDSLELYLADSKLPDPLLVLFDSHERAANDDSKRVLMEILKRVFGFVISEHTDEKKFLVASKEWYSRVGNKLQINVDYHPIPLGRPNKELFVLQN